MGLRYYDDEWDYGITQNFQRSNNLCLVKSWVKSLWYHVLYYTFGSVLEHETWVKSLWKHLISCPALQNCFRPRAENMSEIFVKSCDFMPCITHFFPVLGHKTWVKSMWNHEISCPALHICFLPRAKNMSEIFVKSCNFMPSITDFVSS